MSGEITLTKDFEALGIQADRCVHRGCAILEIYFHNRLLQLAAIDSGELPQDYDIRPELEDAYRAYTESEDPEASPASRELRRQVACEFVAAGFCREVSAQSPQEQYEAGHAGECRWLDGQIVHLHEPATDCQ